MMLRQHYDFTINSDDAQTTLPLRNKQLMLRQHYDFTINSYDAQTTL